MSSRSNLGPSRLALWALASFALAALLSPTGASAQSDYYFPSGDRNFDARIPSPADFLGYDIGTFHTRHDRIVAYMKELAELSDRARYQEIGWTYEHRPMPVLTVTAPENHSRIEEIRLEHLERSQTAPGEDVGSGPAIVHLGFGVHGNETSSSEAAMLTAYWLVAGTGPEAAQRLADGVFHIEPVLNPDGRDRHTHWANMHRSEPFVSDPLDREHNEVWPGGRTNHYWFDLNRDWLPLVNPESRARIDFHHSWRPHLVTDYHEMGANSTYFFEPSKPYSSWNPLLPEELYTEITVSFAEYWAEALDEIGSLYFTKEVFDNSYPGYGSTYPNFLGGLGLVFEQASARGHVQDSRHHGRLTFAFAIRNHVRTALATVRAVIDQKDRMADYQRSYFATALDDADSYGVEGWVFGDPHDHAKNRAFVDLLLRHRIEVHELAEAREVDGMTYEPATSWVVTSRQPMHHLARSIFEHTKPESFADSVFYDASAWTMSLAFGMPAGELSGDLPLGAAVESVPEAAGEVASSPGMVAYLIDWRDSGAMQALQVMHDNGVRSEFTWLPFTAPVGTADRAFPSGAISVPISLQTMSADALNDVMEAAAAVGGVSVYAASSGYNRQGIDLGSNSFRPVRNPRVLMPIGEGLSGYEAGQLWHLLDQQIGMPVTKVDVTDFGRVRLSDYDAMILVSGNLSFISGPRLDALRAWIRAGGTLITMRQAAAWAARNELTPNIASPGFGAPADEEPLPSRGRRAYADAAADGAQGIGGSIWSASIDLTHPLAMGYTQEVMPVWRDHTLFFAPSANEYSTVAALTEDDPHLSGYVSARNRELLRGSPSLMVDALGAGRVVLLIDNPNFRGYWRGTQRLLLNALWFGAEVAVP